MEQYKQIIRDVLADGEWEENRTGVRALTLPGAALFFDLSHGDFPAVTTKQLAFKSAIGELCAFMRGYTSAAAMRAFGSKVWDQNANENKAWLTNPYRQGEDDLGPVYGAQWRRWQAYKLVDTWVDRASRDKQDRDDDIVKHLANNGWDAIGNDITDERTIYFKEIDQIRDAVEKLLNNPTDRRILFHAWNPAELDAMALPPCHLLYTLIPSTATKKLSMTLTIRSSDIGLGLPFNIASAAAMLSLFAHLTGFTPGRLSIFISNAHIYENHMDMVREVLKRAPLKSPKLIIQGLPEPFGTDKLSAVDVAMRKIDALQPDNFMLVDYEHHPAIKAPMAV